MPQDGTVTMVNPPLPLSVEYQMALRAAVEDRAGDLVDLASELVRRPTLVGAEEQGQELVAERLADIGFVVDRVTPDAEAALADPYAGYPTFPYSGRSSVIGRLLGTGGGRSLHLSGHIDVVPVDPADSWTHDPWGGTVADGRLWGRGAGDMKGGLAAYIIAAAAVAETCKGLRGDLLFSSVFEEECGGNGMWSVIRSGHDADATLIGEPTNLRLAYASTGVVWARLTASGESGHSATGGREGPLEGPFDRLTRAISALRSIETELNENVGDPVFAAASEWPYGLTVGKIEGGVWTSSTPAEFVASVRFGFGRDDDPAGIQEKIRTAVNSVSPDVAVTFEAFRARAWCGDTSGPLPDLVGAAHEAALGTDAQFMAFTAATDARYTTGPCLCYGPSAGGYHGKDEWVDIETVKQTALVVAYAAAAWLA